MLPGVEFEPVLAFIAVFVFGFGAVLGKPVGTFISCHFAKTGTLFLEHLVQW
jgi:hypothetical protein